MKKKKRGLNHLNIYLLQPVIVVGQTAAESSLAAGVDLSAGLLLTVGVQEDGGAAGVGDLPSNPPTHTFKKEFNN